MRNRFSNKIFVIVLAYFSGICNAGASPVDPNPMVSHMLKTSWEVLQDCPPPRCIPVMLGQSPAFMAATFDYLKTPFRIFPLSVYGEDLKIIEKNSANLNVRVKEWIGTLPAGVQEIEIVDVIKSGKSLKLSKTVLLNGLAANGQSHIKVKLGAIAESFLNNVTLFPDKKRLSKEKAEVSTGLIKNKEYVSHDFEHVYAVNIDNPLFEEATQKGLDYQKVAYQKMPYSKGYPDVRDIPINMNAWDNYKSGIATDIEEYRKNYPAADEELKKIMHHTSAVTRDHCARDLLFQLFHK